MDPDEPTRRLFDADALRRMPVSSGMMVELQARNTGQIDFLPTDSGPLELWTRPQPGHAYVIGAARQPSEGSTPGWAVACVLDQRTGAQVAQIRQQLPAPRFAEYLALAGHFYRWAFLFPEAGDVTAGLLARKYPLERIYPGPLQPGRPLPWISAPGAIGIEITAATSPKLVSALDAAIRGLRHSITFRSDIARQECLNFVIKPNGKPGPETGSDACVWAAALAVFALDSVPPETHMQPYRQIGEKASPRKRRDPWIDD